MIIGLTGGIGSGKSTVAQLFSDLGVPVYISDIEAKRLMQTSSSLRKKLIALLGEKAYDDNKINRAYIAGKIFNNSELLKGVNAIVHPSVRRSFKIWAKKQKAPYVIQESALIFETGQQSKFDKILLVTAPLEERIFRVMKRDRTEREAVESRMRNQMDDTQKIEASDFVIENTDLEDTKLKVLEIHDILTKMSSK